MGIRIGAPPDSIKDVVRSFVKVTEFDKHLKKAKGHINRNVVEITIKMETIVRKPLMIEIGSFSPTTNTGCLYHILLGQDMTQVQFLSRV